MNPGQGLCIVSATVVLIVMISYGLWRGKRNPKRWAALSAGLGLSVAGLFTPGLLAFAFGVGALFTLGVSTPRIDGAKSIPGWMIEPSIPQLIERDQKRSLPSGNDPLAPVGFAEEIAESPEA